MRWAWLVMATLVLDVGCEACGERAIQAADSSGALSEGAVSSGIPPRPPGEAMSTSTSASGSGSTQATGGGSSGDSTAATVFPDLPPFPEACLDPMPTITMERTQGPEGPVLFDHAYLAESLCSEGWFVDLWDSQSGESVRCIVGEEFPVGEPFECRGSSWGPEMSIELLEPFDDPFPGQATAGVHLHARLTLEGEGWDAQVVFDVPDCGDELCTCPCE